MLRRRERDRQRERESISFYLNPLFSVKLNSGSSMFLFHLLFLLEVGQLWFKSFGQLKMCSVCNEKLAFLQFWRVFTFEICWICIHNISFNFNYLNVKSGWHNYYNQLNILVTVLILRYWVDMGSNLATILFST